MRYLNNIDKGKRLEENCFSYRVSKDHRVFISWYGKQVMILKGKGSEKFLAKIGKAKTAMEEQLIMAKVTGNFKHGNEKIGKGCNHKPYF